jgi:hypothetical protein
MSLVIEARLNSRKRDGHSLAEELLGPSNTHLLLVDVRREANVPTEDPAEMEGAKASRAGESDEGDVLVCVFVEVLACGSPALCSRPSAVGDS